MKDKEDYRRFNRGHKVKVVMCKH